MNWSEKTVLITGGTGSLGTEFASLLLTEYRPKGIIIFSRDEMKQFEMKCRGFDSGHIRYFIGDVRDKERLYRAFCGVDIVVHAAAMKQVPTAEYNPFEAIKTNVIGAANVIDAAIDCGVERVIALSTDKAANGVETLIHWPKPLWRHSGLGLRDPGLPNVERLCREVVSIPVNAEITEQQADIVVECIRSFYAPAHASSARA